MSLPKKAPLPSPLKKTVKTSAGSLLLAEKATTKVLRQTVKDASSRTAGDLAARHDKRDEAIALLLLMASRRLASDTEQALRKAKMAAWAVGARRLQVELRASGAIKSAAAVRLTPPVVTDVQTVTSAESLALAWRQRALYAMQEEDGAVTDVNLDANIARTAATETAQAYDEGHVDGLDEVLDEGLLLVDRWDAMLDACPTCLALDGTTTEVGEPFPSGEEPSYVHVRCRCIRTTIGLPHVAS